MRPPARWNSSRQHKKPEPEPQVARTLLSLEDVAEELQMSTSWVRKQVRDGHLKPQRFGSPVVRFTPEEIARFLQETK